MTDTDRRTEFALTPEDARLLELARAIAVHTEPKRRRTKASPSQKARVWSRAGGQCEGCGDTRELRVHHKVPASQGGTNRPGNLQLLCKFCEDRAHAKARL